MGNCVRQCSTEAAADDARPRPPRDRSLPSAPPLPLLPSSTSASCVPLLTPRSPLPPPYVQQPQPSSESTPLQLLPQDSLRRQRRAKGKKLRKRPSDPHPHAPPSDDSATTASASYTRPMLRAVRINVSSLTHFVPLVHARVEMARQRRERCLRSPVPTSTSVDIRSSSPLPPPPPPCAMGSSLSAFRPAVSSMPVSHRNLPPPQEQLPPLPSPTLPSPKSSCPGRPLQRLLCRMFPSSTSTATWKEVHPRRDCAEEPPPFTKDTEMHLASAHRLIQLRRDIRHRLALVSGCHLSMSAASSSSSSSVPCAPNRSNNRL